MTTPREPPSQLGCLLLSCVLLSWSVPAWSEVGIPASPGAAPGASARQTASLADGLWTQVEPPAWRTWHSAAHDPVRDRMIVFGGYNGLIVLNDVWVFDPVSEAEWLQVHPAGTPPSARATHAAVYDPVRDRMLVFGGGWFDGSAWHFDNNELWALSLGSAPAWSQLHPSGAAPAARGHATLVYDPARDRVLMFAGMTELIALNDVWELSLSGTPTWTLLAPAGTPPPARGQHSALYDGARGRMIVFGGRRASTFYNDVWQLSLGDTPEWSPLAPSDLAPAARSGHAAILDAAHDRMIVWGGADASVYYGDGWSLALGDSPSWAPFAQAGQAPPALLGQTAVYDPGHECMRVFGGYGGHPSTVFTHVWNLTLGEPPVWSDPAVCVGPRATGRDSYSAVHDALAHRMILFGGVNNWVPVGLNYFHDVWTLDLAPHPAWVEITPVVAGPVGRYDHSAVYDPVRNRMVLFGGNTAGGYVNDTWELTLTGEPAWNRLLPSGTAPTARSRCAAIYDPVGDRMLVFGGYGTGGYSNELWSLSLSGAPVWAPIAAGTPPSARYAHSAILDPVGNRMVVFGGYSPAGYLNDLWQLALSGSPAWSQLSPAGPLPAARRHHAAAYDGQRQRMLVSGGRLNSTTLTSDLWALDLAGPPSWTLLDPVDPPTSGLVAHKAIYDPDNDRLLVYSAGFQGDNSLWLMYPAAQLAVPPPAAHPGFTLGPCVPNPSRGETAVTFVLDREVRATLRVLDIGGRVAATLVNEVLPPGERHALWDGRTSDGALARPGVYLLDLRAGGKRLSRRIVLVR